MTTIVLEEPRVYITPKAKRASLIYTLFVLALIGVSFYTIPQFGALYGVGAGVIGIICGLAVRIITKRENKRNNVARLGIWLSSLWVGISLFVYGFVILATWAVEMGTKVGELVA